ncbi:DUF4038 domain-containing protein [Microbacterium sp. X-17]|uniref:apiosidase-like domain-containing protein n=1 Tax=Microbacterium sp. X-17 TaxID=3144404 RepID=UPI0031F5077F
MSPVTVWKPREITFESAAEKPDPGSRVDVLFTGPQGITLHRPAFFDGGRLWRVRVALPVAGDWTYQTTASETSDRGLHGNSGTLTCAETELSHPVYEHGFLRASPTGTYLQHQDGTPFFWLGDTHWRFAWERWDESNKPGWTSQFRDTVDLRIRQGFSVYQSNILSWTPPTFWDRLVSDDELDLSFFREILDPRFEYIANAGLVHAVGLGWYSAVDERPAAVERFAREIVARYGAYPLVWTLGGEVAGYDPELRTQRLDAWRNVALAIQEADAYHHPITAHLTNERPMPADFQSEDWLTFALSQLGHGDMDMGKAHWEDHLRTYPGKPLVEGESFYEGLTSVESNGRRTVTDTMVRQVAYRAIQSGCCGYSYGGQGIWNGAWDANDSTSMWGRSPWYDGVELPGATQMGYLRRFYEGIDWWMLKPAPELFSTDFWTNELFYFPFVSADENRLTVVAYFGETYRHDEGNAQITGLPQTAFTLGWFDPRTGESWVVSIGNSPNQGTLEIPKPPADGDWLFLLVADNG